MSIIALWKSRSILCKIRSDSDNAIYIYNARIKGKRTPAMGPYTDAKRMTNSRKYRRLLRSGTWEMVELTFP